MATIAQNTITLIRVNDGTDGSTISSITREYYLSNSKTSQTGGSWTTTAPAWQYGKYLWTRYKIVYTNPNKTEYTTAYCDSSWEAIDEIQIGGRNYILDSKLILLQGSDNQNKNCSAVVDDYVKIVPINNGNVYNTGVKTSSTREKNVEYTISFEILSPDNIGFYWYPSEYYSKAKYIPANQDWQSISFTYIQTGDNDSSACLFGFRDLIAEHEYRYRNLKLEKGNKATDWTPAPEDTAATIDDINDQLAGMDNIITNTQTNFEQKIDSITATVQQTQQAQIEYENQLVDIRKDISSEIQQVADGINITIEELYTQFGDLGDVTETIRTFFKVTSDGLAIAQDGNPTSTLMGYDHFAILVNEEEVVKVFQDSIDAPNAFFHNSLRVGNIKFTAYDDGVAITWAGD